MTGIERLRELADKYADWGKYHTTIDVVPSGMAMLFSSIANQIEREHAEDCYGMVIDHGTVSRVASEMEHHILGHEGMEDSPVARWARELREALGRHCRDGEGDTVAGSPCDGRADEGVMDVATVRADAMEAWRWVREHGGLDYVMHEWQSRVPLDRYRRLLGHIAECEAALGRRNVRIKELGHRVGDLTRENAELRKRAMPKVLDADGAEIRVGDTVYLLPGEWCDEFPCLGFHGGEELEVFDDEEPVHVPGGVQCREKGKKIGFRGYCYPQPSQLTHTKPEPPDSWERIEEDARLKPLGYVDRVLGWDMSKSHSQNQARSAMTHDLVRRCRALAERERGE